VEYGGIKHDANSQQPKKLCQTKSGPGFFQDCKDSRASFIPEILITGNQSLKT
jgi:hypothetical protein